MADSYYAKYTGVVMDNQDAQKLGILQVSVPTIFPPDERVPARAALPFGQYFVPEVDTRVWVEFEGGDPEFPLWTGVQHAAGTWPDEAAKSPPTVRAVKTVSGHLLVFDDTEGSESIILTDGKIAHELRFDADGVKLTDGVNGHVIVLDAGGIKITDGKNSHEVEMSSSAVNVKHGGGMAKVVLEQTAVKAECGAAKLELIPAMATVDAPMVKLGAGSMPVLHVGDQGIGNLGAPVPITITTQVKVFA
ncbi:MAG TPA: phage baseplate assembly protein V [Phytomonospora sp.]